MLTAESSLNIAQALLRAQAEKEARESGETRTARRTAFSISISREAGAQGTTVAHEVGRRLDWPVYDREILVKIAADMHRPTSVVEAVDERPMHWVEETFGAFASAGVIGTDVYVKHLIHTVRGLGELGRCVLVGRGASFLLPPATTLRVRLIAPLAERVRAAARMRNVAEAEANHWVQTTERERTEFVRRFFHIDPADAHNYDLILNTGRLSVSECADMIVQALLRFRERADGHPNG